MRAHCLFLVVLLSFGSASTAAADAPRVTPTPTPTPTPPEWRALYDAGSAAYDAGRLSEALDDFTRAHDRGGPPALLYDIALTLDRMNRRADAIAAYHRYVDAMPEASNRDIVEARLSELEAPATTTAPVAPSAPILSLVSPEPTATATVTTTTTTPVYTTHAEPTQDHWEQQGPEWTASWVMLGLTALSVGATLIVWYDGQARFDALWDRCASDIGCTATEIAESPAHVNEDATNALLGVSIGLGALTVLTFVVEGVVTGNRLRLVRASTDPHVTLGLGSIGLSGSF